MTDTESKVVLRTLPDGPSGKCYAVLLDGEQLGIVQQIMVTHDRQPRGSRIVTRRTQSLRWVRSGSSYRLWTDTRWESVYRLLREIGLGFVEAEELAKAARVEKN